MKLLFEWLVSVSLVLKIVNGSAPGGRYSRLKLTASSGANISLPLTSSPRCSGVAESAIQKIQYLALRVLLMKKEYHKQSKIYLFKYEFSKSANITMFGMLLVKFSSFPHLFVV